MLTLNSHARVNDGDRRPGRRKQSGPRGRCQGSALTSR
jgi:hypothetical protein